MSLQAPAEAFQSQAAQAETARALLKDKAEILWNEVAFRTLRNGASEAVARCIADEEVGKNWTERLKKALQGELDRVHEAVDAMAVSHAKWLLEIALRTRSDPS